MLLMCAQLMTHMERTSSGICAHSSHALMSHDLTPHAAALQLMTHMEGTSGWRQYRSAPQ